MTHSRHRGSRQRHLPEPARNVMNDPFTSPDAMKGSFMTSAPSGAEPGLPDHPPGTRQANDGRTPP